MPYYKEDEKLHDSVVAQLARLLKKEHPEHDILPNARYRRKMSPVKLRTGRGYFPDIADYTAKIAYEVHWKGSRKEESFDSLADGWKGVDVFITDASTPFSVVVRMPGFKAAFVGGNDLFAV